MKRKLRFKYGHPCAEKDLQVIQKLVMKKRRGDFLLAGDKVRCVNPHSARNGHIGTLIRRYGATKDEMWSIDWTSAPPTRQEQEMRAQLKAFARYDRDTTSGTLGLEMTDLHRLTMLRETRKHNIAATRIQRVWRGARGRKTARRIRSRIRYYRRYHMNRIAAWLFMDTEGTLEQKTVRLNQLLPPPKISFCESVGWTQYSADTSTALNTMHGWSGVIACMRRDAVVRIQRLYKIRLAKLLRARQIILDVFRTKIKRMRDQRQLELDLAKDKFIVPRMCMITMIYSFIAVLTVFCLGLELVRISVDSHLLCNPNALNSTAFAHRYSGSSSTLRHRSVHSQASQPPALTPLHCLIYARTRLQLGWITATW